jgi:hypothetical protein
MSVTRSLCDKRGLTMSYSLILPDDFHDYAWEIEAKGCFNVSVNLKGRFYNLNFYDPTRLSQTVGDDLMSSGYFLDKNIVVIPVVNISEMEKAIQHILNTPYIEYLVEESTT